LPADRFEQQVARLLAPEETDPEVLGPAIRAAAGRRSRLLATLVAARLGHPKVGRDAVEVLGQLGDEVVGLLRERLQDPSTPIEARREIPDVFVRVASPAAERALVDTLLESDPTLRHRIISALNKLRRNNPEIPSEPEAVEMLLTAEIFGHYRSYQVLGVLRERLPADDPVVQGLHQSMEQEVERIFRLLSLLYPHQGLHDAYFGLRAANPSLRADALELLEEVLPSHLDQLLVPLLDSQLSVAERVERADRLVGSGVHTIDQAVGVLLASEDSWLRACAAFAVGALRLDTLAPELDRLADATDPLLRETARTARRRLAGEPVAEGVAEPHAPWPPQPGIEGLGG
jgi:HEAT repeat protein